MSSGSRCLEHQLLILSGPDESALEKCEERLMMSLRADGDEHLAELARSLYRQHVEQVSQGHAVNRRMCVASSAREALRLLAKVKPTRRGARGRADSQRDVVFTLPGGGSQYPRMAQGLYETYAGFRERVDRGLCRLNEITGVDFRPLLFPASDDGLKESEQLLRRPSRQHPLIFVVSHALAECWQAWGVRPSAMLGHSLGENVAACLSKVFSYDDGLALAVLRGRLLERIRGGMLSIQAPASAISAYLEELELDLAAINTPDVSVVSGSEGGLRNLETRLQSRGIGSRRLHIDVAAHSRHVAPTLDELRGFFERIELRPPGMPFVSNLSGTWISPQEATDPEYWVQQFRSTVQFRAGVATTLERFEHPVFLEVGPGEVLTSYASAASERVKTAVCLPTLRHPRERIDDVKYILMTMGHLWLSGISVDLDRMWDSVGLVEGLRSSGPDGGP